MGGLADRKTGVALVGCGIVGGGTASLLLKERSALKQRSGCELELLHVIDRNQTHAKALGVPESILGTDFETALADPKVDVVIELVGGTGFARDLIKHALLAGKHVVTANKALLAEHGKELFALARKQGKSIAFEASCAGGIPIVRALYDGLLANRITALYGIVNGTCNFILSSMLEQGKGYAQALKDAQLAGFAEADPTLDVKGIDSSHKITILGSLAFGKHIQLSQVSVRGIDELDAKDVDAAIKLGYSLKLIAQARLGDGGVFVRVEPAFIARSHSLAWVNGGFNAVSVYGSSVGHTLYYGRGAGASPTASAVVADLLSIASGSYPILFEGLGIWLDQNSEAVILDPELEERRFYLRVEVADRAGTLAEITRILAVHKISVASIHQEELTDTGDGKPPYATVAIIVHSCPEGTMHAALADIRALEAVGKQVSLLPILDEHPEFA